MARNLDPYKLSSPRIFLIRMVVFLGLAGCVAAVLYRRLTEAFLANPWLNGLIFFCLGLGILAAAVLSSRGTAQPAKPDCGEPGIATDPVAGRALAVVNG